MSGSTLNMVAQDYIKDVWHLLLNDCKLLLELLTCTTNRITIVIIAGSPCQALTVYSPWQGTLGVVGSLSVHFHVVPALLLALKILAADSPVIFSLENAGSMLAVHKGYMLGSIVDIFSGVLSGANFGPWVPPFPAYIAMPENMPGNGIGHFFGAMRIDAFRPAKDFKNNMDLWIRRFRDAKPIDSSQPVIIPGEPEQIIQQYRMENGLELNDEVEKDLLNLAEKFNVEL
jgi:hypothetical protein